MDFAHLVIVKRVDARGHTDHGGPDIWLQMSIVHLLHDPDDLRLPHTLPLSPVSDFMSRNFHIDHAKSGTLKKVQNVSY